MNTKKNFDLIPTLNYKTHGITDQVQKRIEKISRGIGAACENEKKE